MPGRYCCTDAVCFVSGRCPLCHTKTKYPLRQQGSFDTATSESAGTGGQLAGKGRSRSEERLHGCRVTGQVTGQVRPGSQVRSGRGHRSGHCHVTGQVTVRPRANSSLGHRSGYYYIQGHRSGYYHVTVRSGLVTSYVMPHMRPPSGHRSGQVWFAGQVAVMSQIGSLPGREPVLVG